MTLEELKDKTHVEIWEHDYDEYPIKVRIVNTWWNKEEPDFEPGDEIFEKLFDIAWDDELDDFNPAIKTPHDEYGETDCEGDEDLEKYWTTWTIEFADSSDELKSKIQSWAMQHFEWDCIKMKNANIEEKQLAFEREQIKKAAREWIESLLKEEKERPAPLPPVSPFENKC